MMNPVGGLCTSTRHAEFRLTGRVEAGDSLLREVSPLSGHGCPKAIWEGAGSDRR